MVGTSAVLDRSQLLAQEELRTPLFDALAYRFTLQLFPGDVDCAGALDRIRAIVDREKPAHTSSRRVRARAGHPGQIPGAPRRRHAARQPDLGTGRLGETGLVLAGQPPSHLGVGSHLGVSTHL